VSETAGLQFVAVADRDRGRLKAASEDFPGVALHEDAEDLARDEEVDVAIVAVPPAHHAELGRRLLAAGKHVVLEKPMCLTVADADDLLTRAADVGRVVTVHQSRRWDRDFLTLRRAVEGGLLGEVFNVETFVGGWDHPCREWHSDVGPSGGAIYDWGSHHVDWILRLYGGELPETVRCTGHKRVWHDVTNLDQLTLHMTWADGREATFRQSDVAAIRRPKFHVQGTLGTLEGHYRPLHTEGLEPGRGYVEHTSHHAEAPVTLRAVTHRTGVGPVEHRLPPAAHPGWGFHVDLADHLLFGEPLDVEPRQPRDVVAVLEAGHRSALEGGTVLAP
jgi:predicted dehydrogenase